MGDEEGTSNGGGTEGTEGFHYLKSEAMNGSSSNNCNVASEILNNKTPQQKSSNANCDLQLILDHLTDGNSNLSQNSSCPMIQATDKVVVQLHLDFREHRERELKFTAAGWKCDCQGKWFRDENVEFDSDEDDPNVCLG
ncbi:uncharacterized protein LOC115980773 [Quercus lobata]|uniref:uncharacterized protein LOC115980773 n=1 Tax=Quercus lobata TaxID=97700 RepID=UPI001243F812|nr:uncharacterized protein LOC115980773 [Quercus lobata]